MTYYLAVNAQDVAQLARRWHKSVSETDSRVDRIVGVPCEDGNDQQYTYPFDRKPDAQAAKHRLAQYGVRSKIVREDY